MNFWVKARTWARQIKRDAVTLWIAYKHPGTPSTTKLLSVFVVAYALSPVDLIPDVIPILGYLDDVILLPCLIWVAIKLVPAGILAECRIAAEQWMLKEGRKPRSSWGMLLVAVLWIGASWIAWEYTVSPYL